MQINDQVTLDTEKTARETDEGKKEMEKKQNKRRMKQIWTHSSYTYKQTIWWYLGLAITSLNSCKLLLEKKTL